MNKCVGFGIGAGVEFPLAVLEARWLQQPLSKCLELVFEEVQKIAAIPQVLRVTRLAKL